MYIIYWTYLRTKKISLGMLKLGATLAAVSMSGGRREQAKTQGHSPEFQEDIL